MLHARIVEELADRLGGQLGLAERFAVDYTTVSRWKSAGIPAKHWPLALEIAREARFRLTLSDISTHSPLHRRRCRAA